MPTPKFPSDAQATLKKVLEVSSKNQQLVGHFQLKGTGLKRLLGSLEIDIIVKKPHYLYLAIGSFFKQPARIVTYDGSKLYGLSEERLDEILNLSITPSDLVDVLLRSLSLNQLEIQTLSVYDNKLIIFYHSGYQLTLFIDPLTFEIIARELRSPNQELIYFIEYKDFPKRFDLEARYHQKNHSMILSSQDTRLNQGDLNEQLFRR